MKYVYQDYNIQSDYLEKVDILKQLIKEHPARSATIMIGEMKDIMTVVDKTNSAPILNNKKVEIINN